MYLCCNVFVTPSSILLMKIRTLDSSHPNNIHYVYWIHITSAMCIYVQLLCFTICLDHWIARLLMFLYFMFCRAYSMACMWFSFHTLLWRRILPLGSNSSLKITVCPWISFTISLVTKQPHYFMLEITRSKLVFYSHSTVLIYNNDSKRAVRDVDLPLLRL